MVETYNDDYESYSLGNIIGQNGWEVDYVRGGTTGRHFNIVEFEGGQRVEGYVRTTWGDGEAAHYFIKKQLGWSDVVLITMSGLLQLSYSSQPAGCDLILRDSNENPICGVGLYGYGDYYFRVRTNVGWINVVTNVHGYLPFEITYNIKTGIYTSVIFNSVEYGPITGTVGSSNIYDVNYGVYQNDRHQETAYTYHDNLIIITKVTPPRYLKYPRWQPTTNGLRPYY